MYVRAAQTIKPAGKCPTRPGVFNYLKNNFTGTPNASRDAGAQERGAGEPKVNKVNKVYVAESATFGGGDFSGAKVRAALSSASGTGEFIVGPRRVHVENCINGKMKLLYKRSFMARVDRRRRRGGGGVFYVRAETPEHIFRHLIFIEPRTVCVRARLWKTLHCRRQPREPLTSAHHY